jgi:transposase
MAALPSLSARIDRTAKQLRLWVRRKRGNRKLVCSGCGRKFADAHDYNEREVRDLPWGEYRTTVIIEVYRLCCPQCGVRVEKVPQLPSKAPFSKRFEVAVGLACESALVRRVAPTVPAGSQHRTSDRPAVSATLECGAAQRSISTNGCG